MNKPLILMILDLSGSMASVIPAMQRSFDQIVEDQSTERGDADLSVWTFGTRSKHSIKPVSFKSKPSVQFTNMEYTRLYDTVIEAINSVPSAYTDVCVLIQTDGEDNESMTSPNVVKNTIEHKLQQGWQFIYMGAFDDITPEAAKLGLEDYAVEFKRDSAGIEQVFNEMSRKISNFRASLDTNILTP